MTDAAAALKAACFDYYTTQQLLAKAEDEHLQLRGIEQQLLQRIEEGRKERDRLVKAAMEVEETRNKESTLPSGVPVAAFDAFVAEERRLLAEAAAANDDIAAHEADIARLEADLVREGRSAIILEEALESQCHFGKVLMSTSNLGRKRVDTEHDQQAKAFAEAQMLQKRVDELKKREAELIKAVRFADSNRGRAQTLLQDRDSDIARLRRDAALGRRLHLAELEHSRAQEAELMRLTTENRKLRGMVDRRRVGRPTLRKAAQDDVASSPVCGAECRDAKGRVRSMPIASTDEVENFQRNAAVLGKGRVVEKYREMNLALLQQMVSTMEALRIVAEPVPHDQHHNHRR